MLAQRTAKKKCGCLSRWGGISQCCGGELQATILMPATRADFYGRGLPCSLANFMRQHPFPALKTHKTAAFIAKSAPFGHKNQFVFRRSCKGGPLFS
jgi:hypothetical protein